MNLRKRLWTFFTQLYPLWLKYRYKMDIGKNCRISWKAHLDKSVNPKGIHIGDNSWVLSDAMILSHDYCRGLITDTRIGKNCVIGIRSIIMPGVTVGDECVIGGGSIVTKDVPNNCIVAGNPSCVIRENIKVCNGKIISAQ